MPEGVPEGTGSVPPTSLSIHSLLINPANATGLGTRPGNRDISPTYLSHLPSIGVAEFSSYIARFGVQYDRYLSAKRLVLQQHLALLEAEHARPAGSGSSNTDAHEALLAGQIHGYGSISNPSRISFDDNRSVFSDGVELGSPTVEADAHLVLETGHTTSDGRVPEFFTAENFDLKNPRTFDLACQGCVLVADSLDETSARRVSQQTTVLQEKLSDHMDVVERQLVDQVSAVGPTFFTALADLLDLERLAEAALTGLTSLQADFSSLQEDEIDNALGSIQLRSVEHGITRLREQVAMLEKRRETGDRLEARLRDGEADPQHCVRLWREYEELSRGSVVDARVSVTRAYDQRIRQTWQGYKSRAQDSLLQKLTVDLDAVVQAASTEKVLHRLRNRHLRRRPVSRDSSVAQTGLPAQTLCDDIMADVQLLAQSSSLESALREYRDGVIRLAKAITKRHLPANDESDSMSSARTGAGPVQKTAALSRALRRMQAGDFTEMLERICSQTCTFLARVQLQQKVLTDLLTRQPDEVTADSWQIVSTQDLLSTLVDVTQGRMGKILNVRAEENSSLSSGPMIRLFDAVRSFTAECEALNGSTGVDLISTLEKQLLASAGDLYGKQSRTVVGALETDSWQALKEAQKHDLAIFDIVADGPQESIESWLLGPAAEQSVSLDGRILTSSTVVLIEIISEAMLLALCIAPLRQSAVKAVVEHLRLFNSRACQLILGAGATKSAGLERITAKHLAIAAEALRNVESLLPGLKTFFTRLAPRAPTTDFDKMAHTYTDHMREIFEKLVSIMSDRTHSICTQIASTQWPVRPLEAGAASATATDASGENLNSEHPPSRVEETGAVGTGTSTAEKVPPPALPTSNYMATLIKDTLVLHKVISRLLQPGTVSHIMERVVDVERKKLTVAFNDIRAESPHASFQIDRDIEQYVRKIGPLVPNLTLEPFA